jgi:hypothetical protein
MNALPTGVFGDKDDRGLIAGLRGPGAPSTCESLHPPTARERRSPPSAAHGEVLLAMAAIQPSEKTQGTQALVKAEMGRLVLPSIATASARDHGLMTRYCFGSSAKGLVRHRGVASHHPPALPAVQGHDDLPGEPRVERHGDAVIPQVMEVEVAMLIVNRDPGVSILRCQRSDVHQAGGSTGPTTAVPRAW